MEYISNSVLAGSQNISALQRQLRSRETAFRAVGLKNAKEAQPFPAAFSYSQLPSPCTSSRLALPIRSYVPVTLNTKLTITAPASTTANTVGPNRSSKPPWPLSRILLARQ